MTPNEEPNEQSTPDTDSSAIDEPTRRSRPRALTPEQRRLLGKRAPLHERSDEESTPREQESARPVAPLPRVEPEKPPVLGVPARDTESGKRESTREKPDASRRVSKSQARPARAIEMQHAAVIIGVVVLLCLTFYAGKKFDYWRYVLFSKNRPTMKGKIPPAYANLSADELVEKALVDERSGDWRKAIERLIAAKQKNLAYREILFHAAQLAYGKGDFDAADKIFERAIAFHEDVDVANYFRGVIATRRRDLPAAERFFEAAATANPFKADYYYYWAEALRLDNHPQEAIPRYEQAERRAASDQDATVCRFKVRMARVEAGDVGKLKSEIEQKAEAGALSLDWLLTRAAIAVYEGRISDASRRLSDAHAHSKDSANGDGVFRSCTGDKIFQEVCRDHIELIDICRTSP